MTCDDLLAEVSGCSRGIPVTTLFRQFFCETKPEKCPFALWERSLQSDAVTERQKRFTIPWRQL
jgi:hypothetical protein